MSGGRGRGKASFSFDIGNLGFGSAQSLPRATLEPPPLYPPLQQRPTPLSATEVDEYLLALSQEFRGSIRDSSFHLKPKTIKKDINRYTDRYKENQKTEDKEWNPDWQHQPNELKPAKKRKIPTKGIVKVNLSKARGQSASIMKPEDIAKKLQSLEAKEVVDGSKPPENEDEEYEEEEIEEEFEDDNDYNFDYYNDGGDKYGDDDDGEEGPVY